MTTPVRKKTCSTRLKDTAKRTVDRLPEPPQRRIFTLPFIVVPHGVSKVKARASRAKSKGFLAAPLTVHTAMFAYGSYPFGADFFALANSKIAVLLRSRNAKNVQDVLCRGTPLIFLYGALLRCA